MSVLECVTKLVAAGTITKAHGDEALALYERSKGEFSKNMGPAEADAAAALATARAMAAGAKRLKNDVAKQAIGFANFERTMLEHPDGPDRRGDGPADAIAAVARHPQRRFRPRGHLEHAVGEVRRRHGALRPGLLGASKDQIASAKEPDPGDIRRTNWG